MPEQTAALDTWAIVEVMGHKKFAGHVTEQVIGAMALIRVDVPETHQPAGYGVPERDTAAYSKLIGPGSIYMITPCTEDVARRASVAIERHNDPIPVALPIERQLPASTSTVAEAEMYEEDDEDRVYLEDMG